MGRQITSEAITSAEIEHRWRSHYWSLYHMLDVEVLSGVYLLIYNESVVYVGKTKNLYQRLQQHRKHGRLFDDWAFLPVSDNDDEELDYIESMIIHHIQPEQNRKLKAFPLNRSRA